MKDIKMSNDYIVIKALEDGVCVEGVTRGSTTRTHHTEKLQKGEVFVAQFTENTAAMKVRGEAILYTGHGEVRSEK